MTAPVALPLMSIPDAGGALGGKAIAALPDSQAAFGAMLSQISEAPDSSATEAENAPASQADGNTVPDAASALAAATVNQTPWAALLDAVKTLPEKQDTAPQTNRSSDTPPEPAPPGPSLWSANAPAIGNASLSNAAQDVKPQSATSRPPVPGETQGTPSPNLAADQTDSGTPVMTANVPPEAPPLQDDTAEAAVVTQPAAPAANHPKDEKPVQMADDAKPSAQPDVMALSEFSSPVAAQFLAASTGPVPQSTPVANSPTNPEPEPEEFLTASLSAAAQTATPRSVAVDRSGNPAKAPASDARTLSEARPADTHESRAAVSADSAPAAANTNDAQNRIVRNAEPPLEHSAKNEPAAAAPNLLQASPATSTVPNHAGFDLPAAAVSNAPPATQLDPSAPVRLSFAAPGMAEPPSFDALALRIAARSSDGDNRFSIRLDPPELGRIEVNLNVRSDGHAQAELSADKPQTLELLQKDASSLERALKDAGLNLAGGLAFSLKGDGKSQAWRDMQGSPRGRNLQIAAADAGNANAGIAISAALAGQAYGLSAARLDIRV